MNAEGGVRSARTTLRVWLVIAAVCTTVFGIMHHVDHIIRGNHSGWPFEQAITPFTFSLLIYALLLPGLYLMAKERLMAGYWLFTSVVGLALVVWVRGLGKQLVGQALGQGHEVTVLVRDPAELEAREERLRIAQGDVPDPACVESAVSALGTPNPRKSSTLLSEGTKNVVGAMERHGVRRLVCVTILGTGESGRRHGSLFYRLFVLGFVVRPMLEDKERQEEVIRGSRLDWTIVRPPRYTDEPPSGDYRVIADGGGRVGKIGRADFMMSQLDDHSYVRKAVVVGH